ncbi:MAG TPA: aminoacyl-histidine dipeptidase [Deltaproteobacteria bacterium]|nr:aminoacyl-histidine dipeptidase [Deltaproteobacteria bacterium]
MKAVDGLSPRSLWEHLREISRIPRCSGHESAVAGHIRDTAARLGLGARVDRAGNVIVKKPGVRGVPPVALQSHLDMVCEKSPGSPHDFMRDPIELVRDGRWIRAKDTSLGADNGIGVAAMLAIMTSENLPHPDLELVFTVEEETGLGGANSIEKGWIGSRTLVNLDSEEEGTLFVGCAGGMHTELSLEADFMSVPEGTSAVALSVSGLLGGHSGIDIHRGRPNAIKVLVRFLDAVFGAYDVHLADISGGTRHNAIPRDARAVCHVNPDDMEALHQEIAHWNGILKSEYDHVDDRCAIHMETPHVQASRVLVPQDARRIVDLLQALPHGPARFCSQWRDVVDTSTNLATCGFIGDILVVTTSQRGITPSAMHDIASQISSVGTLAGCTVNRGGAYPAWRPDPSSPILKACTEVYRGLTGKDPRVKVVHAGLECAVLGERIEGLDMISFGPTIEAAHSPDERVDIDSVARFWDFLTGLLTFLSRRPV